MSFQVNKKYKTSSGQIAEIDLIQNDEMFGTVFKNKTSGEAFISWDLRGITKDAKYNLTVEYNFLDKLEVRLNEYKMQNGHTPTQIFLNQENWEEFLQYNTAYNRETAQMLFQSIPVEHNSSIIGMIEGICFYYESPYITYNYQYTTPIQLGAQHGLMSNQAVQMTGIPSQYLATQQQPGMSLATQTNNRVPISQPATPQIPQKKTIFTKIKQFFKREKN